MSLYLNPDSQSTSACTSPVCSPMLNICTALGMAIQREMYPVNARV